MLIKFLLQLPKFIRSELADGDLVKFSKDRIDLIEKMKRKAITPSFFLMHQIPDIPLEQLKQMPF